MTLNDFAVVLREKFPKLSDVPLNNEDLAQYVLNLYPQYYDFISPSARRIKQVSNLPVTYEPRKFFESSTTDGLNEAQAIQNRRAYIASLHEADMVIKASGMGVPVQALVEMAVESHRTEEFIRKERFIRDNGLQGGEILSLKPHQLIERLQDRLMGLIDALDEESHPTKREVLQIRINGLKEELRGRTKQALVSVGVRDSLGDDENPNGSGGSGTSPEGNLEPVSGTMSRVGF